MAWWCQYALPLRWSSDESTITIKTMQKRTESVLFVPNKWHAILLYQRDLINIEKGGRPLFPLVLANDSMEYKREIALGKPIEIHQRARYNGIPTWFQFGVVKLVVWILENVGVWPEALYQLDNSNRNEVSWSIKVNNKTVELNTYVIPFPVVKLYIGRCVMRWR